MTWFLRINQQGKITCRLHSCPLQCPKPTVQQHSTSSPDPRELWARSTLYRVVFVLPQIASFLFQGLQRDLHLHWRHQPRGRCQHPSLSMYSEIYIGNYFLSFLELKGFQWKPLHCQCHWQWEWLIACCTKVPAKRKLIYMWHIPYFAFLLLVWLFVWFMVWLCTAHSQGMLNLAPCFPYVLFFLTYGICVWLCNASLSSVPFMQGTDRSCCASCRNAISLFMTTSLLPGGIYQKPKQTSQSKGKTRRNRAFFFFFFLAR